MAKDPMALKGSNLVEAMMAMQTIYDNAKMLQLFSDWTSHQKQILEYMEYKASEMLSDLVVKR